MGAWVEGHVGGRVATTRSSALLEIRLSHGTVNALDSRTYREIDEVFSDVAATPGVGTVLLLGDNGCFCAGQDTADSTEISADPEGYLSAAAQALVAVTTSPATIVAAVRRFAIGAGLILATSADVLIVDEDARLALPELQYGVIAGAAHTSRWLGGPAAERALLTGDSIDPQYFALAGAFIVPDSQVEDNARTLATTMSARGASMNRLAKSQQAQARDALAQQYLAEIHATFAAGTIDFSPAER